MNTTRKILHVFLGILFLCIGVIGLVLPILNGVFFLIIGAIILSFESPYIENKLYSLTRKNKTIYLWHIRLEKIIKKIFRK